MPLRLRFVLPLILCGSLVSCAFALRAQQGESQDTTTDTNRPGPPRGGPPTAAQELQRLSQALTLTDAQKTAILPLLEEKRTKIEALIHSSTDRAATGEEIHTINTSTHASIRALLTEAQQKIFDSMRPPHPPQRGGGSGQSGSEPPPPPDGSAPSQ